MGRQKTIRLDDVLDAAERVLVRHGGGVFSIAAVAEEAGITKGGVQSCAGNKEELIGGLIERWLRQEEASFNARIPPDGSIIDKIRIHVAETREMTSATQSKAASVYANMLAAPAAIDQTRAWYSRRMKGLNDADRKVRRARIAFMAAEGLFYTRFLGLVDFTDAEWIDILDDILTLLD